MSPWSRVYLLLIQVPTCTNTSTNVMIYSFAETMSLSLPLIREGLVNVCTLMSCFIAEKCAQGQCDVMTDRCDVTENSLK